MTATTAVRAKRPWAPPVVAALVGAGALAYVALRNPSTQGGFVPCPFHEATGLWCPGCGMTRAFHAMANGHLGTALGYNLFAPLLVAVVAWGWVAWFSPAVGGPSLPKVSVVPRSVWLAVGVALLVYGVARNLPIDPLRALAP